VLDALQRFPDHVPVHSEVETRVRSDGSWSPHEAASDDLPANLLEDLVTERPRPTTRKGLLDGYHAGGGPPMADFGTASERAAVFLARITRRQRTRYEERRRRTSAATAARARNTRRSSGAATRSDNRSCHWRSSLRLVANAPASAAEPGCPPVAASGGVVEPPVPASECEPEAPPAGVGRPGRHQLGQRVGGALVEVRVALVTRADGVATAGKRARAEGRSDAAQGALAERRGAVQKFDLPVKPACDDVTVAVKETLSPASRDCRMT